MAREQAISIRVTTELKKAVEAAAKAEDRTVANWIERLLIRTVKEGGYLKDATEGE